jgi:carbonic anhydrase/acetyltransferase-like protein (isoleucine patch superfamily)
MMTQRQPKGISTGGQFAHDVNQESTVDLGNIGDMVGAPHQMPEGFAVAEWRDVVGTAILDEVSTTYDDLVRTFGEPQFSDPNGLDGEKSTTEWYLETPSGVAHIYDYDDVEGRPLGQFDWHVGGFDIDVVEDIKNEIGLRATYGPVTARVDDTYDFGKGHEPAHQHANGGGWVADTAHVEPSVFVGPDAKVCDFAIVSGGVRLSGHTIVMDRAVVCDNVLLVDAVVMDAATASGDSRATEGCVVKDAAHISGFATAHGPCVIGGNSKVRDYANVFERAEIGGGAVIEGNGAVHGTTVISGSTVVSGNENYPGRTQERS